VDNFLIFVPSIHIPEGLVSIEKVLLFKQGILTAFQEGAQLDTTVLQEYERLEQKSRNYPLTSLYFDRSL